MKKFFQKKSYSQKLFLDPRCYNIERKINRFIMLG